MKLDGEEHKGTLTAASNYATSLIFVKRFEEAKSLLRKTMPVARRVLGESHNLILLWHHSDINLVVVHNKKCAI